MNYLTVRSSKTVVVLLVALMSSAIAKAAAVPAVSQVCHLAPRTDGHPGSGTLDDPYDASTALKFDRLMEDHAKANVTIVLAEGTYLTWGADGEESPLAGANVLPDKRRGFMLPSGVTLRGAGMGRSIIKLTDVDVTGRRIEGMKQHRVLCSGINGRPWWEAEQSNITIEDLTVDANGGAIIRAHQSLPKGDPQHINPWDVAIDGITLGGSNCRVRNVEVKGVYGYAAPNGGPRREAWTIGIGAIYYGNCAGNLIEGCVARDFEGNYVSGVGIGGCGGVDSLGSGIVRDCLVVGNTTYSAYIAGNSNHVIFRDNLALNCAAGFRSDTGVLANIEFRGNVFICGVWPLEIRLQSEANGDSSKKPAYGPFTIAGNLLVGADQMIYVGPGTGPAKGAPQGFSGMDIFNNAMFSTSPEAYFLTIDNAGSSGLISANCRDFRARDNVALSKGNFDSTAAGFYRTWNNRKSAMAPVTELPSKGLSPLVTPEGGSSAASQGITHGTPFKLTFSTSSLKPLKTYVLEGIGLPENARVSPALPRTFSGGAAPTVQISWTPTAAQTGDHVIVLRIRQDDHSGLMSYGFRRISVR
jgi:hypothetical protein